MRMRSIVPAILCCALALGPAATAADNDTAKSKVKITEGGPTHFEGTVSSKAAKCEKGRKVSLEYKFAGPYKGDVLDTVRTDADGDWEMDGNFVAGLYLASVKEKEKGDLLCKADKSIRMEF